MSLRHLHKDLNGLGIYPDLIDGDKSGYKYKEEKYDDNHSVTSYNKYYGWRIYFNNNMYSKKMYTDDNVNSSVTIYNTHDQTLMIFKTTDKTYPIAFGSYTYIINHGDEEIREYDYEMINFDEGKMAAAILLWDIRSIDDLDWLVSDVIKTYRIIYG